MKNILAVPTVAKSVQNNTVVSKDVTNVIQYRCKASGKRKADPASVTADTEFNDTSQFGGTGATPAWFAPAIVAALAPLHLATIRLQNASAMLPHHALAAPPGPDVADFPTTLDKLRNISAVNATVLEAAYNIPLPVRNATLRKRRRAIAAYLGVRAAV